MRRMPSFSSRLLPAVLLIGAALPLAGQSSTSQTPTAQTPAATSGAVLPLSPVPDTMTRNPWNWGVFFSGGPIPRVSPMSTFLRIRDRVGKFLTETNLPGFLLVILEYTPELV